MSSGNKLKTLLLLISDIVALYAGLFLTLVIRYGGAFYVQFTTVHATPFTIMFATWIVIFYIAGLYDLRRLRNDLDFLKTLLIALSVAAVLAAGMFYTIPALGIAPKTTLLIFIIIFALIQVFIRRQWNRVLASQEAPNKVVIVGENGAAAEIVATLGTNPQLGYEVREWIKSAGSGTIGALRAAVEREHANVVVVPRHFKQQGAAATALFELLSSGIEIHDVTNFYELVMGKVPLDDLEETWFLENLFVQNPLYEFAKRAFDVTASLLLAVIAIPLSLLIAVAVRLSSPGPIVLRQPRIGKNSRIYIHYKFRTMRESDKNAWLDEDHARITPIGTFLRKTHLDELPQVLNLLRGDLSLIGPRPDFADFYGKLKDQIPYYSIRTVITPGLSGWAQVNFPVTSSFDETKERLCYDLYYLKNRSLALDFLIALKTIKAVATASGK